MVERPYSLEQLYRDQDFDWVVDAVPAVLAWVPGATKRRREQPFVFDIDHRPTTGGAATHERLALSWSVDALTAQDPTVEQRAARLRAGRTAHREHVTEVAAYGLALAAISVFMPGRRVVGYEKGAAPDILFDAAPTARRGVEAAGRSRGGRSALNRIVAGSPGDPGKRARLSADPDIAEVHLSLWCNAPRLSMLCKVKP
jgi:hypothetical protein